VALSKTQNKRLGAILSVMFKEDVPRCALEEVINEGFVTESEDDFNLTEKGLDEKNRLCTLAGLNIKYQSELNDTDQT
jgi:hypothetical protein